MIAAGPAYAGGPVQVAPEPATITLVATGAAVVGVAAWIRRRKEVAARLSHQPTARRESIAAGRRFPARRALSETGNRSASVRASRSSSFFFRHSPPPYPVNDPSEPITR